MNQRIPHSIYLAPGHFWLFGLHLLREFHSSYHSILHRNGCKDLLWQQPSVSLLLDFS